MVSEPQLVVIGETDLLYTRLGVWMIQMKLDGRGPIKVLLDTGATSTILNWRGVAGMGLSSSSPQLSQNSSPMGAMGADNNALSLTHRIAVQRRVTFPTAANTVTSGPGISLSRDGLLNVDIGSLPVLDILEQDGVGGILGTDVLMRCSAVRLVFQGRNRKIILYE